MENNKILFLTCDKERVAEWKSGFEQKDFAVCGATGDGEEALRIIKKERPAVVFGELFLKNADGLGVMETAIKAGTESAFFFTVPENNARLAKELVRRGARYCFVLPYAAERMAERVEEFMAEEQVDVTEEDLPVTKKKIPAGLLEKRISEIFVSIGIPPHIKGYAYLREGVRLTVEDSKIIDSVTKELYPKIGEKYNTTASKVERAIRHAIEVGWNRGRTEAINAIFGAHVYIGNEKPTNSEFIALVADKLIFEFF